MNEWKQSKQARDGGEKYEGGGSVYGDQDERTSEAAEMNSLWEQLEQTQTKANEEGRRDDGL